jgi:putative ABC transport system ATP-binding protein
LHLLAALDRPTSGTIVVNGRSLGRVHHLDRFRRDEVGLVFQLHNLLPQLSAAQNIEVAMLGTGQHRRARKQRAAELLEAVGMTDKAHARPPKLSGGERQRIAFARALANRPSLILADEPTGSLDSAGVENVLGLLGTLRAERSVTVVMVTHDLHVAAAADRTLTMIDGRIVDQTASSPTARSGESAAITSRSRGLERSARPKVPTDDGRSPLVAQPGLLDDE